MSKQKKSYVEKIRENLKKDNIELDPLLDATLEELERLINIRDTLYNSYLEKDELFREHTNKAGATNVLIMQEVSEYKNYSDKFNKTVSAIEKMIEARKPIQEKEVKKEDPLVKIIRRDVSG